jgi:hypothetical protein
LMSPRDDVPDHVDMTQVHPVEAADRQRRGPNRTRGQSKVDLQLSTFSGTNVRRSGSACPSATRRPPVS